MPKTSEGESLREILSRNDMQGSRSHDAVQLLLKSTPVNRRGYVMASAFSHMPHSAGNQGMGLRDVLTELVVAADRHDLRPPLTDELRNGC